MAGSGSDQRGQTHPAATGGVAGCLCLSAALWPRLLFHGLLSHFLLHADTGLKVAQIARLLHLSRPTASRQQGLSSKEAIQVAQHRMAGRPYGKLLPRYAGPIAEFLLTQPQASRYDILDFIQRTWDVRVSTVALHHFLKKYGLDHASAAARHPAPRPAPLPLAAPLPPPAAPPRPWPS